jgi:8-oxo-dGTP pyrophosphatase MutT (NUDIX family)
LVRGRRILTDRGEPEWRKRAAQFDRTSAQQSYNRRMITSGVLAAIHARLALELAPPTSALRPLRIDGVAAGWVDDVRATRLAKFGDVFDVAADCIVFAVGIDDCASRTTAMARVARVLADDGLLTRWRDERYAVAHEFGAEPWFELERAASRYFGVLTHAAHVNGLVHRSDGGIAMWIARRSDTKAIDPGMLDNLVGGGIAAGQSVASTVIKEAFEEAGIDALVASQAIGAGKVHICREQPDGVQRETIFVHDLWLSEDFVPECRDGEAVEHRLVSLHEAAALIANSERPDAVTADASLVILDCLLRHNIITADAPLRRPLETLRIARHARCACSS